MSERPPFSPVVALLTLSSVWDTQLNTALREFGLTTRKYGLLAHIKGMPDISFSELARRSQITVQTAHAAVRALTTDGLVSDSTAQAGAASTLRVTPAGEEALIRADMLLARLDDLFRGYAPGLAEALRGSHEAPFGEDIHATGAARPAHAGH